MSFFPVVWMLVLFVGLTAPRDVAANGDVEETMTDDEKDKDVTPSPEDIKPADQPGYLKQSQPDQASEEKKESYNPPVEEEEKKDDKANDGPSRQAQRSDNGASGNDQKDADDSMTGPQGQKPADEPTDEMQDKNGPDKQLSIDQPLIPGRTIRLRGGTSTSGRIEVYIDGRWGTVCDDYFTDTDARVACAQLGLSGGQALYGSRVPDGTLDIALDNLGCVGTESSLQTCLHRGFWVDDCSHHEDVGVSCSPIGSDEAQGIRLRGGTSTSGRVEVYIGGQWGTVCDDGFSSVDARVACRQLGHSGGTALYLSDVPDGSLSIALDDLQCAGTESSLQTCSHSGAWTHNCRHAEDVGVSCVNTGDSDEAQGIRLRDGTSSSGRIEVYIAGRWGTVCDDNFDANDARVACSQLGFAGGSVLSSSSIRDGTLNIALDDLACTGTEDSLQDCLPRRYWVHDCSHREDVGVSCVSAGPDEVRGIRLRGGTTRSGRIEVYLNGRWGTVCDDFFGNVDASVACTQLGYGRGTALYGSSVPDGTLDIALDNLGCTGTETDLRNCRHNGAWIDDCRHIEDVGVSCTADPEQQQGIRLRGGTATRGRIEVFIEGRWGTVCDDYFDLSDARVACRQLGLSGGTYLRGASVPDGTLPIALDNLGCRGTETTLQSCSHRGYWINDCSHSEDVGVSCTLSDEEVRGIRLRDGTQSSGRVEVYIDGRWGTVCDDGFGTNDARVACRQLGLQGGGILSSSSVRDGSLPIALDDLACRGTERTLQTCSHRGSWSHNCGHSEDVGVTCDTDVTPEEDRGIRLRGGTTTSGRVEVYINGRWGTVCDDGFTNIDARVACRQLDFEDGTALSSIRVPDGTLPIALDDLGCTGSEISLQTCPHDGYWNHNCVHYEDVGVTCTSGSENARGVRLRGGTSTSGRLEVLVGGRWGTVCDDGFGITDARVACRQLGLRNGAVLSGSSVPDGTLPIALDDLGCRGSESSLQTCTHGGFWSHNCAHSEDVGVTCSGDETRGIRLRDGTATRGRIEVYINGTWGTVCDDSFGTSDARVACRQLGLSGGTVLVSSRVPDGTAPIALDDLACTGTERSLQSCSHRGYWRHNCRHSEDVGVICS